MSAAHLQRGREEERKRGREEEKKRRREEERWVVK
jgi:hypothetical protein